MPTVTVLSCKYCGQRSVIFNTGSVIHCPACVNLNLSDLIIKQVRIDDEADWNQFKIDF